MFSSCAIIVPIINAYYVLFVSGEVDCWVVIQDSSSLCLKRQELPTLNAGISPLAARRYMVLSLTFKYSATSLIVRIESVMREKFTLVEEVQEIQFTL